MMPPIQTGDCTHIITPSGPITHEREAFDHGIAVIKSHGLAAHIDPAVFARHHYLAGTTADRQKAVSDAWTNGDSSILWTSRGGMGALHLLPALQALPVPDQWLIGYSDVTALFPLFWNHHRSVLHGASVTALARWQDAAIEQQFEILKGDTHRSYDLVGSNALAGNNHYQGRLVGGNLSVLCSLIGVLPNIFGFDDEPLLLFIEDVQEATYKIERMLVQLKLAGLLDRVQALVLGQFTNCNRLNDDATSTTDALMRITEELQIPAFYGLEVGHQRNSLPLLLGPGYQVDATTLQTL